MDKAGARQVMRHNLKLFGNVHIDVTTIARAMRIPADGVDDGQIPEPDSATYDHWILYTKDYGPDGRQVIIRLTEEASIAYDRFSGYNRRPRPGRRRLRTLP